MLTDDTAVTYEKDITASPAAEPTETPLPAVTPEPTETHEPTPYTGQIEVAYDRSADTYDFKDTFLPMLGIFESVDMTILNFEGICAGKEAGYTQPRPTAEPATS